MNSEKKILLGIPTYKFLTAFAFGHMMGTLLDGVNSGLIRRLEIEADMYVTMARNQMCATALDLFGKGEITHLLMIDDDMIIPNGAIAKLASTDLDVVGGAYYTRDLRPVAYMFEPFGFLKDIPKEGIIPIGGTGAGFLLISCKILMRMKEHYGNEWWFQNSVEVDSGQEKYLGEDVFFFRRLREMGIQAYLDCDIQCGHIGLSVVDRTAYEMHRQSVKESPTPPGGG
jgi:hypothetical protein